MYRVDGVDSPCHVELCYLALEVICTDILHASAKLINNKTPTYEATPSVMAVQGLRAS